MKVGILAGGLGTRLSEETTVKTKPMVEIGEYIDGDDTLFEREPLERLAAKGQVLAYRHKDSWACMDTMCDEVMLERFRETGDAPWKVWV